MDQGFGDLVAALTARGLYRDTLLVFTSDHGEEFGEHGAVGWHSHTLYRELLHVPLLVKLPRSDHAGATVAAMVRSLDIAPTILAVAGLAPPAEFEGVDLLPWLDGAPHPPLPAIFWRETMPFEAGIFSGIRAGRFTLHGGHLYDLAADPGERHDLSALQPAVRNDLAARLARVIASRAPLHGVSVPIDPETQRSLHALGYAH
jgi:arylsulfatase A-like enzyme